MCACELSALGSQSEKPAARYVVHERWYLPSSGLDAEPVVKLSTYAPMPFKRALDTLNRWRAQQPALGGGLSDFWMVPYV